MQAAWVVLVRIKDWERYGLRVSPWLRIFRRGCRLDQVPDAGRVSGLSGTRGA